MATAALGWAPTPPSLRASTTRTSGAGWVGQVLGGAHRILSCLDEGGMATVFEGEDVRSGRPVAIKVLSAAMACQPELRARFHAEADALERLEHPNIVRVLGEGATPPGDPYLALELLQGENLRARLDRDGRVSLDVGVQIVVQLASALAAAHSLAIVHRDVKPANVFLTRSPDGAIFVKLIDFGICKDLLVDDDEEHECSGLVGTPSYMAPEQANGDTALVDHRADQHALALLAYEMLTGLQPFSAEDAVSTLHRVRTLVPKPASQVASDLPAQIDAVLARALAKSAEARFTDVCEFARRLTEACGAPGEEPGAPRCSGIFDLSSRSSSTRRDPRDEASGPDSLATTRSLSESAPATPPQTSRPDWTLPSVAPGW